MMKWLAGDRYVTDNGTVVILDIADDNGIKVTDTEGLPHFFTTGGLCRCAAPCIHGHLARRITGTIHDTGRG